MATVTAAVLALTAGCADDGDSDGSAGSTPRDSEAPATPSPPSGDGPVFDSAACQEVRAGIDAFNEGRYDETVARFEAAVPLAEEQDDGSVRAGELVEAVRYYAELDAELYPEAARSSREFATYKAITLGQCVAGDDDTSESPGTEV